MSDPRALSPADSALDECGCCAGISDQVPALISNRPGLASIGYRAGTFSTFKRSMLAGLTDQQRARLNDLRTRDDDDFSIALIDAWAVVGDVLTFYAERIANEQYLRTAGEDRSIAGLARLIGYRLRPGVAASTHLAFMLETAPGSPGRAPIPAGTTRVQSIPGPGELPQTFETLEDIDGFAAWNAPLPRLRAPRIPRNGDDRLWLAGDAPNLGPGDLLLFVGASRIDKHDSTRWEVARIVSVERITEPERRVPTLGPPSVTTRTVVHWQGGLTKLEAEPTEPVSVFVLRRGAALFGYNAPDPRLFTDEIRESIAAALLFPGDEEEDVDVIVWKFEAIEDSTLYLDAVYDGLTVGSWLVLSKLGEPTRLARIKNVSEVSRSDYALSAKVTMLTVDLPNASLIDFGGQNLRGTTLSLLSEPLPLIDVPVVEPVVGAEIVVTGVLDELDAPRKLLVRGQRQRLRPPEDTGLTLTLADGTEAFVPAGASAIALSRRPDPPGLPGQVLWRLRTDEGAEGETTVATDTLQYAAAHADDPRVAEVATVLAARPYPLDPSATILTLASDLLNVYDRATVELFGNVAAATHGESVSEVLGSGDAAKSYQSFTLRRIPLTYISAADPSGAASTLQVRVNGLLWREVPSFFGCGPRDRVYVTEIDDRGATVVRFGDGLTGARPPTGHENITATYRAGIGRDGEVAVDQLSLLMTRPLGVKSVTNPVAAAGAQDPQARDDARVNAPLTVRTLDRIVSLGDYEDFARAFAGIGKAMAVWVWIGDRRGPLITVAGADGGLIDEADALYTNLVSAIARAGNARVPFVLKSYRPMTFRVKARISVQPDYLPENVLAAVRAALSARFSFAARGFGQLVALSQVVEVIQTVAGVVAVDVDHLHRTDEPPLLNPFLIADAPAFGDAASVSGAELLTIDPASLESLEVRQ